jgi:hypothetical protein
MTVLPERLKEKTYDEINKDFFNLVSETFHSVYTQEEYVQIIYHLAQLARDMELVHDEEVKSLSETLHRKLAIEQFKRQRVEEEFERPNKEWYGYHDEW